MDCGSGSRAEIQREISLWQGARKLDFKRFTDLGIKSLFLGKSCPIFTLIEQTYNILYILLVEHHSCCPHCFPLGRGPPLGCRAEIRTRACRTASRRATIWATPHPYLCYTALCTNKNNPITGKEIYSSLLIGVNILLLCCNSEPSGTLSFRTGFGTGIAFPVNFYRCSSSLVRKILVVTHQIGDQFFLNLNSGEPKWRSKRKKSWMDRCYILRITDISWSLGSFMEL